MSYKEVTRWLFGLRRAGRPRQLDNIRRLLSEMGNPHDRFQSIHVTGTNGKGSTAAMAASILAAAKHKVGMFTSPHLSSFTERIVIDGKQVGRQDVVKIVEEIKPLVDQISLDSKGPLTFFELATSIAMKYFADNQVDFAVLEAGMGGRLDATNVVHAPVSVITNVSLEHTESLGKTVLEIAKEKAGIIKQGGTLITATEDDGVFTLFERICEERHSKIFRVGRDITFRRLSSSLEGQSFQLDALMNRFDELRLPLLGYHQLLNAACAVGAVEALGYHDVAISADAIDAGLRRVKWPGRLEIVQRDPLVVLDCAKDPEAARALKETMLNDFAFDRLIAVVSISSSKNIPEMIAQFAQIADRFIITTHKVMGRAAAPSKIAKEVERHCKPYEILMDTKSAVRKALQLASQNDIVCIAGSMFLVGEAREFWAGK